MLLFWIIAAVLVIAARVAIEPRSPAGGSVAAIAILMVTAFAYMRLAARESDVTHALGAGIAWLALSIATEIVLTKYAGHGWFTLLGSPDHPLLRNVVLFAWIFAPALFARHRDSAR